MYSSNTDSTDLKMALLSKASTTDSRLENGQSALGGKRTGAALAACQFRAIMRKNKRVFVKQKSLILQDLCMMVVYYGVLIGLSLTVSTKVFPSVELMDIMVISPDTTMSNAAQPALRSLTGCTTEGGACTIAFIDDATNCKDDKSQIAEYMNMVPACGDPAFICECLDDSTSFRNYTLAMGYTAGYRV